MAELIYPNSKKISGPWLVDHDQLMELDSILKDGWDSLIRYREQRIEEVLEARLDALEEDEKDAKRDIIKEQIEGSYKFSEVPHNIWTG